jgi:hypothetical protein
MNSITEPLSRVLVILDQTYGERLCSAWPGQPVWIEPSSVNEPVVRQLREKNPEHTHLTGITVMVPKPNANSEERLLTMLDTIELHHGSHSTSAPYTELEVLGCPLTGHIKTALGKLGFSDFVERESGFTARRTAEQALVRR